MLAIMETIYVVTGKTILPRYDALLGVASSVSILLLASLPA
ncbi:hypothetical protein ACLK17_06215 [Escherichia coli]